MFGSKLFQPSSPCCTVKREIASWLDGVAVRLLRAGLPINYVDRVVCELKDHVVDESQFSEAQACDALVNSRVLGVDAETLASQFIVSYRKANWFRRLPKFCWLFAPVPVCLLTYLAWYVASLTVLELVFGIFERPSISPTALTLLEGVYYAGKLTSPAIAGWLLVNAISRAGISWRVKAASALVLAFMFLITSSDLTLPSSAAGTTLVLTIDFEQELNASMVCWQVAQSAVVLLILLSEFLRLRQRINRSLSLLR